MSTSYCLVCEKCVEAAKKMREVGVDDTIIESLESHYPLWWFNHKEDCTETLNAWLDKHKEHGEIDFVGEC